MTSAYSRPVLVPEKGNGILLERLPLGGDESGLAYNENWVQDLVYRHPATLPVDDIDESFAGMVPLCREMATPAGPVDVVYVTRDGRPVIVEAKLWRNPEARRKVIGQILDYAKELAQWDFEAFDAQVRAARRAEDQAAPKGVLELVGIAANSPEAARFHDSLARALRRGDFLLLIVGDGIREGAAGIAEFLRRHASLHFVLGMVELAIYALPGGGRLVQPRVLAQSVITQRMVIDLRTGTIADESETDREPPEQAPPDEAAAAVAERQHQFWVQFIQELKLDRGDQPVGAPAKGANQFFNLPQQSDAWISAYLAQASSTAGVYVTFRKGPVGDRLYDALEEDRAAVEQELGVPVEWKSDGKKHWIMTTRRFQGPLLERSAAEVQRALADWTNRYVNVFRPRIEKLTHEMS